MFEALGVEEAGVGLGSEVMQGFVNKIARFKSSIVPKLSVILTNQNTQAQAQLSIFDTNVVLNDKNNHSARLIMFGKPNQSQ